MGDGASCALAAAGNAKSPAAANAPSVRRPLVREPVRTCRRGTINPFSWVASWRSPAPRSTWNDWGMPIPRVARRHSKGNATGCSTAQHPCW